MPNFYSRLNLASSIFPFYTEAAGRTIMLPQYDENWDRYNAANTSQDKGVPQVFYMHNCVPIAGGFQSIGYNKQFDGLEGVTNFDDCLVLYNEDGTTYLFSPAGGLNYIYDGNVGNWVSFPFPTGDVKAGVLVTAARVKGQSYIYYSQYGCFKYNNIAKTFDPVTLTGLTPTLVLSICEANGYMIATAAASVAWSSLSDPTDFIPSIQTGAGGGAVQDAKGVIKFALGMSGGFAIYCEKNAVGATFTANTAFPFIIQEIKGSGGVDVPSKIAFQSTLAYHIAFTTAGIQQLNLDDAVPIFPEVSDFLTAQIFEDFKENTLQFSSIFLPSQLAIKFTTVAARYIIFSYGINSAALTHALIFDIALNRFGRLKINHRAFFMFSNPAPYGIVTYSQMLRTKISQLADTMEYSDFFTVTQSAANPKQNLAVLQQDGTVRVVNFSIQEAGSDGVFIIGKFQMQRNNLITHQTTEVETIEVGSDFSLSLLPTFNGKDFAPAIPTVQNLKGKQVRLYAKRFSAFNISLCLTGAFNLTSLIFRWTIQGSR